VKTSIRFLAPLLLLAAQGCGPPLATVDANLFPAPPHNAITFWGHACAYIDVDGFGIVTDPVFEKKTLFRWRKIPAPPPSSYQNARIVLLSHAHPDHMSPQTLETFPDSTIILCPEPSAGYLDKLGRKVVIMRPGDIYEIPGGRIIAVRAKHMGGRYSICAGTDGRALGYVIESPMEKIYYSGDTNLFETIADIGLIYAPDVALLNINGHLHSKDAITAAEETHARKIVPMHFGAYGYFFFGTRRLPRNHEEMERALGAPYKVLRPGESLPLEPSRLRPWESKPLP